MFSVYASLAIAGLLLLTFDKARYSGDPRTVSRLAARAIALAGDL